MCKSFFHDTNYKRWYLLILLISTSWFIGSGKTEDTVTSIRDQPQSITPSSEKFCNQSNFYQSLQFCICDDICSTLDKCCTDEKYCNHDTKQEDFVCTETPLHGSIYMITKCLPNYPYKNVVNNCLTTNKTSILENFLLSLPVTTTRNITYKNLFCAVCNNEESYIIWNAALRYEIDNQNEYIVLPNSSRSSIEVYFQPTTDPYLILSNLTVDIHQLKLISTVDDIVYRCEVQAYLPFDKIGSIQHCGPTTTPNCSVCDQRDDNNCVNSTSYDNIVLLDLRNPYLPKTSNRFYQYIFENPSGKFHFYESINKTTETCFPKDQATCLVNKFLEIKKDFQYIDKDTTILVNQYNTQYGRDEWSNTLSRHFVYFCGTVIPLTKVQKFFNSMNNLITLVLDILSMFSLLLLLIIISFDEKMMLQGLSYKVTFSTCFTQFLLNILYNLRKLIHFSIMWNAILHHLCLSYFAWLLIATYNLWNGICYATNNSEPVTGKRDLRKFYIFCLFGWIAPLVIVLIAICFELAPIWLIPCELKPGYGVNGGFLNNAIPYHYLFFYPITILCFMTAILFIHTFYHIFSMTRRGAQILPQTNNFKFFVKLAFAMGATWIVYFLLLIYDDILILKTIGTILDSSQGIFMFFAYGFETSVFINMYERIVG